MARMRGLEDREAGWLARHIFRGIRRRVGRLPDTWRIAAHQPGLLLGWALHELSYERARSVDRRLRTLVQHLCVAMTRTPANFSPAQIVELVTAISLENFRARFNRPFDVGALGFSEGAFCLLPER